MLSNLKLFGTLGALTLFTVLGPGLGALTLISTSQFWFDSLIQLGNLNFLLFPILTCLLTGLSLIPTHATSLIAGILFGPIFGPILALVSVSASAIFGYIVMAYIVGQKLVNSLSEHPKAKMVHEQLLKQNSKRTTLIIVLIRLSPIMPFAATNLILSASKTNLSQYIIGSTIGLAPRVIIVALVGVGLKQLDLSQSGDQKIAILGVASTFILVVLFSKIIKRAIKPIG